MTNDGRRGFTLIELIVALVLLVIVGGSMYQVLLTVQRVTGRQTEQAAIHGNLRSGIQLIQGELQEIATNSLAGTPTSDILSMSATVLQYRAARGMGESCGTPTLTSVKIRQSSYSGLQTPLNGRRLYILWDRDTTKISDDQWASAPISGDATAGTCPDGQPSWDVALSSSLAGTITVPIGELTAVANTPSAGEGAIPVRIYETMEMGPFNDAGTIWLGLRSLSAGEATLVPVIGPLHEGGISFEYFDKARNGSTDPNTVTSIRVTLIAISTRDVSTKMDGTVGGLSDNIVIRAQLRNSQ